MRNLIIWTLSILLGFEPALWAQGKAEQQAQIKAFLEKSELAKQPMSLRELYERNASLLSPAEKQSLKKFVDTYGDQKLPKMDVTKVKVGNKEYYQLQAVQNGRSVTWEILGENTAFERVNGKTITVEDMKSVPDMMAKLGVPASDVQKFFPRVPASAQNGPILTADQLSKLSVQDRIQYYKKLRLLLESMEAVENSFEKHKTSSVDPSSKFQFVLNLITGNAAIAGGERSCVAAGWAAVARPDRAGRLKCGSDGKNGVAEEYRRKNSAGDLCSPDKFACNPAIYGTGSGKADLCVSGSRETTAICNKQIRDQDIPDIAQTKQEFESFRTSALTEAERILSACSGGSPDPEISESPLEDLPSGADAPVPAKKGKKKSKSSAPGKKKKKASAKPNTSGLDDDQKYTCGNFRQRYNQIQSWSCDNADFAAKHPQICKVEKTEPTPTQPPTQPVAPAPTPAPAGPPRCDQLPVNEAPEGSDCDGGTVSNKATGQTTCMDGDKERRILECNCTSGSFIGHFKCSKSNNGDSDGDRGGRVKRKEKDGPNWWLIGGLGLGGLLLFHWLTKKAVDQQYQQIQPLPQNPPIPPPSVTVPAPRGVQ